MRRFAREEGQVSRSEFKLLEALEVFGIDLPPTRRGARSGRVARAAGHACCARLTSMSLRSIPAISTTRLGSDPGVRHKRMTAEAYLAAEPDSFDLIVNDMRMDGRDSARLMVAFAPLLYTATAPPS